MPGIDHPAVAFSAEQAIEQIGRGDHSILSRDAAVYAEGL